jgi:hypothetical protein
MAPGANSSIRQQAQQLGFHERPGLVRIVAFPLTEKLVHVGTESAVMLDDVNRAKIVITNFHAFKFRERIDLSAGGRSLLQGRGDELNTQETEGQMIQRVMPDLMGLKNILVLNDEAHHCYREKPASDEEEDLKGDEKKEAEKNNDAARLWISGLEAVNRKLGVSQVGIKYTGEVGAAGASMARHKSRSCSTWSWLGQGTKA